MDIKKGSFVTREQLINCGWKYNHNIGQIEVWEQVVECLLYEPKEGQVIGVYQKSVYSRVVIASL